MICNVTRTELRAELDHLRSPVERCISLLIEFLNALDVEFEDLEEDEDDDVIVEPSLGATEDLNQNIAWMQTEPAFTFDLEVDECGLVFLPESRKLTKNDQSPIWGIESFIDPSNRPRRPVYHSV